MSLFSKSKDPVCGMKVEKKSSLKKFGRYFCSERCLEKYEKSISKSGEITSCCKKH